MMLKKLFFNKSFTRSVLFTIINYYSNLSYAIKITMTPEEKIERYKWWVLKTLKERFLLSKSKELPILFHSRDYQLYDYNNDSEAPPQIIFDSILMKVQETGAIKCEPYNLDLAAIYSSESVKGAKTGDEIYINQSVFDKLYKKYKKRFGSANLSHIGNKKITLQFYPQGEVGIATFNTNNAEFKNGDKTFALLDFLDKNPDVIWSNEEVIENCNLTIKNKRFWFKGYEDIDDTARRIKGKLKVRKSEYFPICYETTEKKEGWIFYKT